MQLRQIGVVRSEYKTRKGVPRLGGPASVEVFPDYAAGLHRLEKNSHLWVLAWMNQAERDILEVTPRGVTDRGPDGIHGVFAVRSPVRPNPIGLTLGRVLRVDGLRIDFDRLDFIDGTPVVDLKPYFLSRDAVYSARNTQIGKPAGRDALREALRLQAENFHGPGAADTALAVDLFTHFRADVLDMVEPANLRVTVPLDRPSLVDAFIGMTRATPGRGTLEFGPPDLVRLHHDGGVSEYALSGDSWRAL